MKKMMSGLLTILFVVCFAMVFSCDTGEKTPPPPPPGEEEGELVTVAGSWDWATSDDSQLNGATNGGYGDQSVFAPGGASKIENAVDDPEGEEDRYGNVVKRPFLKTDALDNDGVPITVPVYNFTGVTKVSSNNRAATEGARFPLVGWEAIPADDETLENLQKAYGYSFWVRLNSSTSTLASFGLTDNWAYLTAIVTDMPMEQGHEYVHYFGSKPGDSVDNVNYTQLAAGTWHKITVVMDINSEECNITQPKWIHLYNTSFLKDFHQDVASKIQWQIQLQHNGGTARSRDPYDITNGEYSFDLDFYGLELHVAE
jgi:hypothetical protein